jgi:dihydroorotate dehydrogenase
MPDWSYRPLLRPLLFRLAPRQARGLTLSVVGRLGQHPAGWWLLDTVGRLRPHASLARQVWGLTFRAPVGLGAGLDVDGRAVRGLATFGLGFTEIGPLTLVPVQADDSTGPAVTRRPADEVLMSPDLPINSGVQAAVLALQGTRTPGLPLLARLAHAPHASGAERACEWTALIQTLAPVVDAFTVDLSAQEAGDLSADTLRALVEAAAPRPLALAIPADLDEATLLAVAQRVQAAGAGGVLLKDTLLRDGRLEAGPEVLAPTLRSLPLLRHQLGPDAVLIAGGAHTPGDVLAVLNAGATLVHLRAGLVFQGPGLAHRAHETLALSAPSAPAPLGWPWMAMLGLGLAFGGALAAWVGLVFVVLPYDEAFVGLSRAGLEQINHHLLAFLTHDRLTLAGTMLSLGVLYLGLALFPLRRGLAWAWDALVWSATLGFLSFGLFLGYGYFDPLHGAVAALLLPMQLLGLRGRPRQEGRGEVPDLTNDRTWRVGMAGQLLWVATGVGLVLAGLTISLVGITTVFVPQDLSFMNTTADALHAANPRLVSLIAHDRAGFGGALASNGIGVLLSVLWGYRRGARWLWWTLLASGAPGFTAALWVHHHVGYLDFWHLAPAVIGLALFVGALALSAGFLHSGHREGPQAARAKAQAWKRA